MTSSLSSRPEELGQNVLVSPRSCLACSKRKVRCSRSHPCLICVERGIACIYPANTIRRPRGPGKKKAVGTEDEDMRRRVSKLESLLENLSERLARGHNPRVEDKCDKVHTLANRESHSRIGRTNFAEERGSNQCVQLDDIQKEHPGFNQQDLTWLVENNGRTLYISNTFWTSLSDEIEDLHELLDCQSEDSSSSIEEAEVVSSVVRGHNFIFGIKGNLESTQTWFLQASKIQIYGRVFLRNVHPMFPIFHRQQTEGILQKAVYQSTNLNRREVAYLAVVSFSAVTSMSVEDVENEFGGPKPAILEHHQHAAEHALTEAELMSTNDLGTLQAFVLFIICLRRCDNARHIWMLVGLALRIALAVGLHRDGEKFGLPPFQTEMRRRLWWQIYVLEIRAAEDQGCNSTVNRDSFDTKLPLNINDEDIKVDATSAPIPRSGFTDMTFGIIRYETILLSHAVQPSRLASSQKSEEFTVADKLRQIAACEEKLQMNYLQFVSTQEPRAIIANVLARTAIAKMKLAIQNSFHRHLGHEADTTKMPEHTPLDEEISEKLFLLSISVLEDSIFLSTEPSIKQWAWASQKYIHWHPLIIILTDLCRRPFSSLSGRAWKAVDGVLQFGNIRDDATICDRDAVLWRPIMRLMEKARRNSGACLTPAMVAVAAEMSTMEDSETVENIIEADNIKARGHVSDDLNLLDCPATLRTSSLNDAILPPFISSAEFNQCTGVACENYPQDPWDSSMNQFYFDMLGDESTYFQEPIFRNTGDWW